AFGNERWFSSKAVYPDFCHNPDDIDWKVSWQLFYDVKGSRCRSMKTSRRWSFLIKCFTRSFPLGVTCLLCLPSLYQDICCPSCFDTSIIEDWAHLFTCSKLQASWESLEKNCRATMTSFIAELTAKSTHHLPHPRSPTNYIESLWTNS